MANYVKNKLEVQTEMVKCNVAEDLYGIFFEEINRSGDGGLYPELIRNRSFEDSLVPKDCSISQDGQILSTSTGWTDQFNHGEGLKRWDRYYEPTEIPAWYSHDAKISLNTTDTLNKNREAALNVVFSTEGFIYNTGFNGISLVKGKEYIFYTFAKCPNAHTTAAISVYLEDRRQPVSSIGNITISGEAYKKYTLRLKAEMSGSDFRLVIKSDDNVCIRFGFVSLMPTLTYKQHGLRTDLMEMLKRLNPRFLRFPGGCAVEGISKQNAWRFTDTLGPVWERKTHQIPWHYRATNGIGYHEFLQMCEDLDVSAMYVVNCGITCQARNPYFFHENEIEEWIRQASNAIDYAISDASENEWGKKRSQASHPEPFKLKYVEIGNENNHSPYFERYSKFYEILKKRYPDITFIANTHTEKEGLPTEIVDEHFYNNATFFAKGTTFFDSKERSEPKIFLGEYAVTCGTDVSNLKAAIAEAAFLLGIENNQDMVTLASYAPLFSNIHYKSWHPNLIEFDNQHAFGIPSYYALSMLGQNRGKVVYPIRLHSGMVTEKHIGHPGLLTNALHLKMRNVTVNGKQTHITHILSGDMCESGEIFETVPGKPSFMADFPGFAHSLNGYTFAVMGSEDMTDMIYEGDLCIDSSDSEVALTVYNYNSPQLAQIDETIDLENEWTPDSVDFCSWTIKGGKSNVYNSHWFTNTPLGEETDFPIPFGEAFHFKIETWSDGFDCYVNGKLLHHVRFEQFKVLSATAAGDGKHIILKITNFGDNDLPVMVYLDCDIEKDFQIETLGGVSGKETNTIDNPLNIIPQISKKTGAGHEFCITLAKNSLNIVTLERK